MAKCRFKVVGEKKSFKTIVDDISYDVGVWWDDNKDWAIYVLPVAVGLGAWTVKLLVKGGANCLKDISRSRLLKKEQMLKELYCYDRSMGHYWKLNRTLTANEWKKVAARKAAGETLAEILDSMHVI